MLAPYPGFVGPTYQSQSPIADSELCMNWYPEPIGSPNSKPKSPPMALYPSPGLSLFASASNAPNRCTFEQDGRAFVVIGYRFGELDSGGNFTFYGNVDADTHPAYIASNGDGGNTLLICSGGSAYSFNLNTLVFAAVVIPNLGNAHFIGYLGARFLVLDANTSTIWISDQYSTNISATMFRQRSLASDRWKSMVVTRTSIWLIGSQSYEVWYNSGASPIPFEPIQGALFPTGIFAAHSALKLGDNVAWLSGGSDGMGEVVLAAQYAPETVSDFSVAFRIQQAKRDGSDISDAQSMTYQEDGHTFMVLSSINANFTSVFDLTTRMWHDRGYWNHTRAYFEAWRPLYHMFAFGYHLVGDRSTGDIYKMGINLYSDVGGAEIRRVRRAPHLDSMTRNVFFNELRLDVQGGLGLLSGQGVDPRINLRYSDDGGMTWGNDLSASTGKRGKYATDVWFNQLGMARDRVHEIWTSDPIPWRIMAAYIDAEAGTF